MGNAYLFRNAGGNRFGEILFVVARLGVLALLVVQLMFYCLGVKRRYNICIDNMYVWPSLNLLKSFTPYKTVCLCDDGFLQRNVCVNQKINRLIS